MKTFCWVITILCCIVAGIILISTSIGSNGAPQQAAGAAIAAALVVIPYVFTRAVSELSGNDTPPQRKHLSEIERKAKLYDGKLTI